MEQEESKTRKASQKYYVFEILDNEGNVIENATVDKNVRIIGVFPKLTEEMFDVIQQNPNAVRAKW